MTVDEKYLAVLCIFARRIQNDDEMYKETMEVIERVSSILQRLELKQLPIFVRLLKATKDENQLKKLLANFYIKNSHRTVVVPMVPFLSAYDEHATLELHENSQEGEYLHVAKITKFVYEIKKEWNIA